MNTNISVEKQRYLEIELAEILDKSVEIAASLGMNEAELLTCLTDHFPLSVSRTQAQTASLSDFHPDAGP